jgi:ATP-dependent Clp protease ATP-binding subunit ClpC
MKGLVDEVKALGNIILVIDEVHSIVGVGDSEGSMNAANILKPSLSRGEIQVIGATTLNEYRKYIEKDSALERRFQPIIVDEPSIEETKKILGGIKKYYETYHKIHISDEIISRAVELSERYITDRCLPDKAIDVMDETGSMVRLKNPKKTACVTAEDVASMISKMTGIPSGQIAESEGVRLMKMGEKLRGRIIGQDEAIDKVVRAIQRGRAGIKDPGKPIGTFIFFGQTGVGKTQLAKSLAEYLFDSEDNMIRLDMSEYMEKFNVSRLIGAPPGYVGFEEGGQLSERVRRKPYCVVLLDEIEKAHPDVFNLLLQVMDEGRLTDSNGRTVSFRNTILIMTSNVGSRELDEYGSGVGFSTSVKNVQGNRKNVLEKAVRKAFPPEFIKQSRRTGVLQTS